MNRVRIVAHALVATLLVALALPVNAAPDKLLRLVSVTPTALSPTAIVGTDPCSSENVGKLPRVTATLKNESPRAGNSTINSGSVTLVTDVQGVVLCNPSAAAGGTLVVSGTSVLLSNMPGVRPSGTFQISVSVYVPVTATCSEGTWLAQAYAGNSFNGDPFLAPPGEPDAVEAPALVGCDVILACSGSSYTEVSGSNSTTITREPNKDGSTCQELALNVYFSEQDRTVQVQYDESNANIVLKTMTTWPIEQLTGTWPKRTRVAWKTDTNGPIYIDAPACVSSDTPTLANGLATMPLMNYLPTSSPYYSTTDRARVCVISEAFDMQPLSLCPTYTTTSGCAIVETWMYMQGDPWLSRN